MSRNFDILHKDAAAHTRVFPPQMPQPNAPTAGNGHADHKNGNVLLDMAHEGILRLVQGVFILPGPAKAPAVLAFCGINRGAGCSWVCARTAEMLAQQDAGTVCIVDANFRSPALHSFFAHENHSGFADAVRDSRPVSELARRVPEKNLWLITAGKVGPEPNGALHASRLRMRITELRSEFDYILFDTPAADAYPDAVLLGQLTDGIILVVGSNSTRRETARIAKASFEAARIPLFGAVLNKRTFPIPEPLYRHL